MSKYKWKKHIIKTNTNIAGFLSSIEEGLDRFLGEPITFSTSHSIINEVESRLIDLEVNEMVNSARLVDVDMENNTLNVELVINPSLEAINIQINLE